jgi:hypothetical protein
MKQTRLIITVYYTVQYHCTEGIDTKNLFSVSEIGWLLLINPIGIGNRKKVQEICPGIFQHQIKKTVFIVLGSKNCFSQLTLA